MNESDLSNREEGLTGGIQPHFAQPIGSKALQRHMDNGRQILSKILPENFFALKPSDANRWLSKNLPVMTWEEPENTPDFVMVYFLSSSNREVNSEKVVLDVIRRWLIPEKEVHISGYQNIYFYMREVCDQLFFLAEVKVFVEDGRDLNTIKKHLPLLKTELALSLSSSQYLERYVDTKALAFDEKATQVQQYMRELLRRLPSQFDFSLFRDMSAFFALSQPDFRKHRHAKHLARIIVSNFVMKKRVDHALSVAPEKRHLELRFIRSKLHFIFGTKPVLGLSVVVSLKDEYEMFEDTQILAAVQKFLPQAQIVKKSYYHWRPNRDRVKYTYIELEKRSGSQFDQEEIHLLKRELKEELLKRIVKLVPSVFMIRNEEEIMRNLLLLSQELKYLSDFPQVMVHFEKQDQDQLYFTVLAVRVLKKHDLPIEECFQKGKRAFHFRLDRKQNVGYVRKKNPKEANVFHLRIPKDGSILRTDSSVNFYSARQRVISIITEALGEVRDYNGGMILKQGELFAQFKHAFEDVAEKNHELLENFFFSLSPIEAQATLSLSHLKALFTLFREAIKAELPKRESVFHKSVNRKNGVFVVIRSKDPSLQAVIDLELSQLENFSKSLIKGQISPQGATIHGWIYECSDPSLRKQFRTIIDGGIKKWVENRVKQQELHLGFLELPPSLDPRIAVEERSTTIFKMLFDGLMRQNPKGEIAPALAKSFEVSEDGKRYTFHLRPSNWSDGTLLVAFDFEYAWKRVLSPSFYTPFAYFFYPIKNARGAKEGLVSLEKVGIKAVDKNTLVIDLESPTSGFLELTAHSIYSPIPSNVDKRHPNWAQAGEELFVGNGPFRLEKALANGRYIFAKNPQYWDKNAVKLDRIFLSKHSLHALNEMYNNDEIDWLGRPLCFWEPYFSGKYKKKVFHKKFSDLHWCVFNTQRFPFDHLKLRRALAYAINRDEIVKSLPMETIPAISPLPLEHSQFSQKTGLNGKQKLAKKLFKEALGELGLTKETFPLLTIAHIRGTIREKIPKAIAKQWQEVLGISCRIENYEFEVHFPKMIKGDFQIGMMGWAALIDNPVYTLTAFRDRSSRVNFSKWENQKYQQLLDFAEQAIDEEKRRGYLKEAEQILIEEYPVIPITHQPHEYAYKDRLKGVLCLQTGSVDFKWASVQ